MRRVWVWAAWGAMTACRPPESAVVVDRGERAVDRVPVRQEPVEGFLPSDPTRRGLLPERLEAFVARAREEDTSALLIAKDGYLVFADGFGGDLDRPSFAMSVSKSVTALALGSLVVDGPLSLDAPLSASVVPEWADDERRAITLRQLLHHTSGLSTQRWSPSSPHPTIEAQGVGAELVSEPGTTFAYNNQAADFLAVVAERVHPEGAFFDDHVTHSLERPLRMVGATWLKDPEGTPRAAGEYLVRPIDLLKLGQLVLDGGRWQGQQVVAEAWVQALTAPGPRYEGCGLLWWRDQSADGTEMWRADGYLGQFIAIVPEEQLVVVRMRDPRRAGWDAEVATWPSYRADVFALAGHPAPTQ